MKTHYSIAFLLLLGAKALVAQSDTLSLQQAIDMALQNNHLLRVKTLQVDEKQARVGEDKVKHFPSLTVNATYQYNVNVGELTIPAGSFGALPLGPSVVLPLPNEDKSFQLGDHNTYSAGATLYQPLTQQGKIHTAVGISKTEVQIAQKEKEKVAQQISQAVEKLYYGLLINRKQTEEAGARLEAADMRLLDVEQALLAGKTAEVNKAGLQAAIADEEQSLLKLEIQAQDYLSELKRLTGLRSDKVILAEVSVPAYTVPTLDQSKSEASGGNLDLAIAGLNKQKIELGISAARQSFLPDLGLIAGYSYQKGNTLFPNHNPYAGASLRWNVQEVFSNSKVLKQRNLLMQQAQENLANVQEQVSSDVEKAYRKVAQTEALVKAAAKALKFREADQKVQQDRHVAGLNTNADVLTARSQLAKSQADLYSAQLAYRLAVSDLNYLSGK